MSSFKKNLSIQGAQNLLQLFVLFGLTWLQYQALTPGEIGRFAWGQALVIMIANFGDLGISASEN